MKQIFRRKTYFRLQRMPVLCILLFVMLLLTACEQTGQEVPNVLPTVTPAVENSVPVAEITPTDKIDFQLSEMKEIYYYTVNPDSFETEAVSAMVQSDYADQPEELMILVADSLEDAGYEVGVNSVTLDGENVIVDLMTDMCPVIGLTEEEEKAVLDAIAQSLLDNFVQQNGVVFQVMGEAYRSENFSFGQYYVYMKNHHN